MILVNFGIVQSLIICKMIICSVTKVKIFLFIYIDAFVIFPFLNYTFDNWNHYYDWFGFET